MHFGKGFHQRQPDARTGVVHVYLIEAFEDMFDVFGRNAHARIRDLITQPLRSVPLELRKGKVYPTVFGRKLKGA